jgi:Dihydrodipicolinate synthase/N-acetylneuraminate lyase
MISKGVSGIAYLGTSGEFGVLTLDEKKLMISEMTTHVDKRVDVLIGVGDTCLKNTLELIAYAEKHGADGVLVVNPYFSIYGEALVENYYDEIANSTELPIVIYNFPALTGFDFNVDLVKRLVSKHSNIVGIKDTIGDIEHLKKMTAIKEINPDFSVFCAYETQALDMLLYGVDGFVNATSNFAPEFTVGLYRAIHENNLEDAVAYFKLMCKASNIYTYSLPLFLAVKEAVYQRVLGRSGSERLPAMPLNQTAKYQITKELKALNLI